MKTKLEVEFPKGCKTFEQKIEFLIEGMKKDAYSLTKIEQKGVKRVHRLGQRGILMKKVVKKHKKGKMPDILKEHFPDLSMRTLQRYMKLAERVDLVKSPSLAYLGQTRLYQLIEIAGKRTIEELLNEVDIDFDHDSGKGAIIRFKEKIDEFIRYRKGGHSEEIKEAKRPVKSGVKQVKQSAESFITSIKSAIKEGGTSTKKERQELMKIIETVEEKLATLKKNLKQKSSQNRNA